MSCQACVVTVNEQPVYGTAVVNAEALRLQVWWREWEALGLAEGQTAVVRVPGQPETRYLIAEVVAVPHTGNVWAHLVAPVEVRRPAPKIVPKVKLFRGR